MAETLVSPGVLTRENDISFLAPLPLEASACFLGPTVKGPVEQPTVITSYGQYQRLFGTTFKSGSGKFEYLTSLAVKSYFSQGGDSALVARVVSGSFSAGTSTTVAAATSSYDDPIVFETIGKGALYNNSTGSGDPGSEYSDNSLVSGSADNLRWEITNVDNQKGTFSVLVRRGDDNNKNKVILETFNNVSLDPESDSYIEKVIGNQYKSKTSDGDEYYIESYGEYVNRSNYIRVASVNKQTLNYVATDGLTVNVDDDGLSYSSSLPVAQSGSFYGATGELYNTSRTANFFDEIDGTDTQGLDGANYTDIISILTNKDEYVIKMITAPGLLYSNHSTQLDSIISLCESRGDCIAILDLVGKGETVSNVQGEADTLNSSYAATYWPWLQVGSATGKNEWVPASVVIPGVYAFTDNAAAPWFAPAGLTRGGIPGVIQTERKLTRNSRDDLYTKNVNPIATFPGSGISVFGQKTLQKKASALDRVNVRRLLIELKKFLGDTAKGLVFEQNTIATRNRFLSTVNPYMESVVQRQGLYAFKVVMDDTNNTSDTIDRNQLIGQIWIQPAKTIEYVMLDFTITPSGVEFGS